MTCATIIQLSIAIILFLTFVAVFKYAKITKEMWTESVKQTKEIAKQTELQQAPYIVLDYKDNLICRNIGNSPAINVEVSSFEAIDRNSGKLVFRINFPLLYVLEPKKEKILEPEIEFKDKDLEYIVEAQQWAGTKFFPFFPEESKKDEYPLTIEYKNIKNVLYRTSVNVKCREKKIQILNIERVGQIQKMN